MAASTIQQANHHQQQQDDDTANFFHNPNQYDEAYWEQYLAARPKYDTCGYYDQVFAYHDEHHGGYHTAHDVATGPGQVARVLAARGFRHVVASDANAAHLDICRHRNGGFASSERSETKWDFLVSPGEGVADRVPPASADAVFVGEALALMDAEAAINGFARVLKPGGTLAVWFYGRPLFVSADDDDDTDKEQNKKCQAIYDRIVTTLFGRAIKGGGPAQQAGWKRATDGMAGWFDNVVFPSDTWADVRRRKWNPHGRLCFYDDEACDFPVEPAVRPSASAVANNEEENEETQAAVEEVVDHDFWAERWDVGEVRRFVEVNLPKFDEVAGARGGADAEVEAWYEELGAAMGGPGAKRKIAWPVVLLLASRK